jgi:hypothetical protein
MRLPDLDLRGRPRAAWLAGLTLIGLAIVAVAGAAVIRMSSPHPEHTTNHAPAQRVPARAASGHPSGTTAPQPAQPALTHEGRQLEKAPHVQPATSTAYPRIHGPATHQPDLFARAFATRLLTQDYRTPRRQLLAWVQAESATTTEPIVIGLVPKDQRDKWALYSLTTDQSTPVIPPKEEWRRLARHHGHTTVKLQQVSEPVSWSQAVLAGKVTDPGITAREIDALVTLHTTDHGKPHSSVTSVALTITLEGPPSRGSYGFVTAVTYDVAPGAPR